MYVRMTQGRYNPALHDQMQRFTHERFLPLLRRQPGFRHYVAAVDREQGNSITMTFWDTRQQAEVLPPAILELRQQFEAQGLWFETPTVYEVMAQAAPANGSVLTSTTAPEG